MELFNPRIRNSSIQYTRFSQHCTCSHSYSSRAKVGLNLCPGNESSTEAFKTPRDYRLAMIRRAIFGWDTWRFAAMLGELAPKMFICSLLMSVFRLLYLSV